MDTRQEICLRMGQAWSITKSLDVIWRSTLTIDYKISFFKSIIQSMLLYGCETWVVTDTLMKRLDGCYTNL